MVGVEEAIALAATIGKDTDSNIFVRTCLQSLFFLTLSPTHIFQKIVTMYDFRTHLSWITVTSASTLQQSNERLSRLHKCLIRRFAIVTYKIQALKTRKVNIFFKNCNCFIILIIEKAIALFSETFVLFNPWRTLFRVTFHFDSLQILQRHWFISLIEEWLSSHLALGSKIWIRNAVTRDSYHRLLLWLIWLHIKFCKY